MYSKKVLDHFSNPRNHGKLDDANGIGIAGNPVCGDLMKLYIEVSKNNNDKEYIKNIKFETLGCTSAIATSSMITELAKGKTLDKALKITRQDVADELEGLPPIKMHCSNLAAEALKKAIEDYKSRT
ncbi:MAG: iron-sulfur cluster assembly scaffold protein [bacterium]|nr:iron-sulfur cluster assembly scaffold protein [bacterium]